MKNELTSPANKTAPKVIIEAARKTAFSAETTNPKSTPSASSIAATTSTTATPPATPSPALKNLTYAIVGLGIMGGSIAKSIKESVLSEALAMGRVLAANRSASSIKAALSDGVIDEGFSMEEVDKMLAVADITFVCLYPQMTADFLVAHKTAFKPGSIVSDISGVKSVFAPILSEMDGAPFDFIMAHPMAGGEKEGYAASSAKFFLRHNYIVIPRPANKSENLSKFDSLIAAMGFSRIIKTDAATHDKKIAFTSQLCHVIAASLVDSSEDCKITAFGGGSFEDLTRIAKINAPLWTELFLLNKAALLPHIERFEASLNTLKRAIENDDSKTLTAFLDAVREKRINMGSIITSESK